MPSPPPEHRIDVLTLFPAILDGYLGQSILSRAIALGLVSVERFDIRNWPRGNTSRSTIGLSAAAREWS